jgi:hypothetical protein
MNSEIRYCVSVHLLLQTYKHRIDAQTLLVADGFDAVCAQEV